MRRSEGRCLLLQDATFVAWSFINATNAIIKFEFRTHADIDSCGRHAPDHRPLGEGPMLRINNTMRTIVAPTRRDARIRRVHTTPAAFAALRLPSGVSTYRRLLSRSTRPLRAIAASLRITVARGMPIKSAGLNAVIWPPGRRWPRRISAARPAHWMRTGVLATACRKAGACHPGCGVAGRVAASRPLDRLVHIDGHFPIYLQTTLSKSLK